MKQTLFAIVVTQNIPAQYAPVPSNMYDGGTIIKGVKYYYDRHILAAYPGVYDARKHFNDICERHYNWQQLERTPESAIFRSYQSDYVYHYCIDEIEVEF